jgi:hypothetical protein
VLLSSARLSCVPVLLRSISNRNIHSTFDIRLQHQVSEAGFSGIWPSGPRAGTLGPQDTQFVAPCLMTHKIVSKSRGFESMVVVYAGVWRRRCLWSCLQVQRGRLLLCTWHAVLFPACQTSRCLTGKRPCVDLAEPVCNFARCGLCHRGVRYSCRLCFKLVCLQQSSPYRMQPRPLHEHRLVQLRCEQLPTSMCGARCCLCAVLGAPRRCRLLSC